MILLLPGYESLFGAASFIVNGEKRQIKYRKYIGLFR